MPSPDVRPGGPPELGSLPPQTREAALGALGMLEGAAKAHLSRREAIKMATVFVLGLNPLLQVACSVVEAQPPPPATVPLPAATLVPRPTETKGPSPTIISSDLFLQGLSAIGGESSVPVPTATPDGGVKTEQKSVSDLLTYASKVWHEGFKAADLQDPIKALKFTLAYAELTGIQGKIDVSKTFPALPLTLGRISINNLPGNQTVEAVIHGTPQNLTIKKDTHMTIVGISAINGGSAVVAFDDFGRSDKDGSPQLFLATVSLNDVTTLINLNDGSVDTTYGVVTLPDGKIGSQTMIIADETMAVAGVDPTFAETIGKAEGAFFVASAKNPIVPYPPAEVTGGRSYQIVQTIKDGSIVAINRDNRVVMAQAIYNETTNQWSWGPYVEPTPTPEPIRHLLQETKPADLPLARVIPVGAEAPRLVVQMDRKDGALFLVPGLHISLPPDLLSKPDDALIVGWLRGGILRDASTTPDHKIHLQIEVHDASGKLIMIDGLLAAKETDGVFSYAVPNAPDKSHLTIADLYKNALMGFYIPLDQIDGLKTHLIGTPGNPLIVYGGYLIPG